MNQSESAKQIEISIGSSATMDDLKRGRKNERVFWRHFDDTGHYVSDKSNIKWAVCKGCKELFRGHSRTMANHINNCAEATKEARDDAGNFIQDAKEKEHKENEKRAANTISGAKQSKLRIRRPSPMSMLLTIRKPTPRTRRKEEVEIFEEATLDSVLLPMVKRAEEMEKLNKILELEEVLRITSKKRNAMEFEAGVLAEIQTQLMKPLSRDSKIKLEALLEEDLRKRQSIAKILTDYLRSLPITLSKLSKLLSRKGDTSTQSKGAPLIETKAENEDEIAAKEASGDIGGTGESTNNDDLDAMGDTYFRNFIEPPEPNIYEDIC